MADLKKVLKGLECCKDPMVSGIKCDICPYWDDNNPDEYQISCNDKLCADALELLKGKQQQKKTGKWVGEEHWFMCSECHFDCPSFITDWSYKQVRTKYCPHCGAKMKNCERRKGN